MTVECYNCGILSKEVKQPLKFIVVRGYEGKEGWFKYFCSLICLMEWLKKELGG